MWALVGHCDEKNNNQKINTSHQMRNIWEKEKEADLENPLRDPEGLR